MRTIYKYPLQTTDEQIVRMPHGAEILCVQTQNGVPCLWARVDPSMSAENRKIRIHGTGHACLPDDRYIGTYQLHGGALVFHVFDASFEKE